jgi:iron complex transport system permease protein
MPDALLENALARRLMLNLRLPRIIMAILTGMVLSASGTVFQMVFRNPLVDAGFLGVISGASFGASLAIVLLGGKAWTVQTCAAVFGLSALAGSFFLGQRIRFGDWALRLVLAGIAVSSLFSAGIGALKMAADPLRQLPEITFWLLGGLWSAGWREVWFLLPPVAAGLAAVTALRWRLNVLSLDDRVAHSLGTAPERERLGLLLAATLATSSAVAVSGLVAWIGLLAPHAARRLAGSDARRALPAGMLLGALVVLVCDDIARTALPAEIPLGILTSLVGAAGFAALMATSGRGRGG